MKRVVVIGFDGLDPRLAAKLIAARQMPNFARLQAGGTLCDLGTTYPAETPVAFATFATGTNPGGHGIFDFIRRDPTTYLPDHALNRYEQKSRFLPPKVVNLRQGVPVWQVLTEAGVPSAVLRAPCTYAPDAIAGRMLSGMGVPDLRGGLGTPTYYTSQENVAANHDENVVEVEPEADGTVRTYVIGPRNPANRQDCRAEIVVRVDRDRKQAVIESSGDPASLTVGEGQWSGWLRLKFKLGFLQAMRGMVRFHLASAGPQFALYASPVNFDPDAPLFPISSPPEYAGELSGRLGLFATTGMVEEHTGLNNGRIDELAFLAQCEDSWREREQMFFLELARQREGLVFCLFDTPDRIQHMFWRHTEPDHPANGGRPRYDLAHVIEDAYRRCDVIVGRALEQLGDDSLLMVMSDHGFGTFRRAVYLNAWLRSQGLLFLKEGVEPGDPAGDMLRSVDWSRTRAYSIGLSGLYVNLRGREAEGIVRPDEARALQDQIAAGLPKLRDPASGMAVVRSVLRRDEIYSGPYAADSPDLVVNCAEGCRISWRSARGGVHHECVDDNEKRWSGDHIIDPALTPGLLATNQALRPRKTDLRDLAPTILAALGVPPGQAMEGESLL